MNSDREPVNLKFGDVFKGATIGKLAAALVECAQVFYVVAVVQREHRAAMHVLVKTFGRTSADALRRAVGRDKLRVLGLNLYQTSKERVIFRVGNLGIVVNVIQLFVTANLFAQTLYLAFYGLAFRRQVPFVPLSFFHHKYLS
jgi:hypothetical protein